MGIDELIAVNGFSQSQPLGDGEVLRIPTNPKGSVVIESVVGAGDIESERVLLKHRGEGELAMGGWSLEDEDGNRYSFPQLIFYRNGAVQINTRDGVDTVVDLFWNSAVPIWQSGETVYLRDAQNQVHTSYKIP